MRPKKKLEEKKVSPLSFFHLLTTCIEFLNELVNLKAFLFITITEVFFTCAKFIFLRYTWAEVLNLSFLTLRPANASFSILSAHQTIVFFLFFSIFSIIF
jgi:hypothetical protein